MNTCRPIQPGQIPSSHAAQLLYASEFALARYEIYKFTSKIYKLVFLRACITRHAATCSLLDPLAGSGDSGVSGGSSCVDRGLPRAVRLLHPPMLLASPLPTQAEVRLSAHARVGAFGGGPNFIYVGGQKSMQLGH